jgi:hypothetical protein
VIREIYLKRDCNVTPAEYCPKWLEFLKGIVMYMIPVKNEFFGSWEKMIIDKEWLGLESNEQGLLGHRQSDE